MGESKPSESIPYRDPILCAFCFVLVGAVLTLDLLTPLGVSVPILYVPVLLLSLAHRGRWLILCCALVCSAATVAGWVWSQSGGEVWKVMTNRFSVLFVIAVITSLALFHKKREQELARARAQAQIAEQENSVKEARIVAVTETLTVVHDIFNNFLNNMRWFCVQLEESPHNAANHLREMDESIDSAAAQLRKINVERLG